MLNCSKTGSITYADVVKLGISCLELVEKCFILDTLIRRIDRLP